MPTYFTFTHPDLDRLGPASLFYQRGLGRRSAVIRLGQLGLFLATKRPSLTARTREVIILSVGSVWKTPYELYAHAAVAIKCGISSEAVAALIAGVEAVDVAEDEKIAQRFTRQLVIEHAVDDQTYARARERFGDRALVEMVTLIGCYLTVCALLNAFAPGP